MFSVIYSGNEKNDNLEGNKGRKSSDVKNIWGGYCQGNQQNTKKIWNISVIVLKIFNGKINERNQSGF